jgi:hypothetical protein
LFQIDALSNWPQIRAKNIPKGHSNYSHYFFGLCQILAKMMHSRNSTKVSSKASILLYPLPLTVQDGQRLLIKKSLKTAAPKMGVVQRRERRQGESQKTAL